MTVTAAVVTSPQPARRDLVAGLVVGGGLVAAIGAAAAEYVAVLAVPVLVAALVAVIDQRTGRIATIHAVVVAAVTVAACGIGIAAGDGSWASTVAGAGLWVGPLFLLAVFAGFGGGDFKFAVSLGAATGWVSLGCAALGLLLAALVASLVGVAVAVRHRTVRAEVRLGVPLLVGAVAAIMLQPALALG